MKKLSRFELAVLQSSIKDWPGTGSSISQKIFKTLDDIAIEEDQPLPIVLYISVLSTMRYLIKIFDDEVIDFFLLTLTESIAKERNNENNKN